MAEAVTLAHVARPVALAQSLDARQYDVHFAHHPRYRDLLGELAFTEHEMQSISPQQFTQALALGQPLYDLATLIRYVEADQQLIAAVQPDVIIGDFRLSLAVSAELAGIPYVALSNAYWSPFCKQHYRIPELPLTRLLGPRLGQRVFTLARPLAFALHCLPMHRLRKRYGLRSLGFDLARVYTHADCTLYADVPEFYRMAPLPARHRFIGPVVWSPAFALPPWWPDLPAGRSIVYVTLGSSGSANLLPELVAALGQLELTAVVSTAGAPLPASVPDNVYIAPYLPGEDAVAKASLVICNGGSPTTHQALAQGVPVIGVASNLDQYLNMSAIEKSGAGRLLRAGNCNAAQLVLLIKAMLAEPAVTAAAAAAARLFATYDAPRAFAGVLAQLCGPAQPGGAASISRHNHGGRPP
jgi:UDP:flavonoid glycosyltransferase YjiC (YdhE family)